MKKRKTQQLFFFFFKRKTRKKHKTLNFKAPWLHQLVVDAPGPDVSRGRELAAWMPPSPPKGLHR